MIRSKLTVFLFVMLSSSPTWAIEGNMLKTMPHGLYECALPGDAAGPAWNPVENAGFTIGAASSYRAVPRGRGTYLLKGDELTFTRGPKKGEKYRRTGENELQKLGLGDAPERLRCVRIARDH